MLRRDERPSRHGWNSLQGYFNAHDRRIADLCNEGFIVEDGLARDWLGDDLIAIRGRLRCQHELFVDVRKYLEVRQTIAGIQVRTVKYRYHTGVEGEFDRPVLRYDNADIKTGHADAHHKHRFDPTTWQEIEPPLSIGEVDWPHLSEVIEELQDWWEMTGRHLNLR